MGCMHIMLGRSSGGMAESMCSPRRRGTTGWRGWGRWCRAGREVSTGGGSVLPIAGRKMAERAKSVENTFSRKITPENARLLVS